MEITDVRTVLLTTPYGIDGTHARRRSAAFIEVETDEGIVGVGETYAGVYMPELVPGIVALYRDVLVGRDATNPSRLYRDCYWVTGYCGRTGLTVMVLAGIECALWDALGKFRDAPLHALLGGAVHDRLPLYASGSGGEGITTAAVFEQWLRAGAFDIAQPDPTIVGGIGEARRACEAAAAHHVKVAMHVWGSAPALTANYHLGFTQPNCVMLERPVMGNPLETEMLVEPLQTVDGHVLAPRAPGLGVALTGEIKAKYPYEPGSASMFG